MPREGKSSWETQSVSTDEDANSDEEAVKSPGRNNTIRRKSVQKGAKERRKQPVMVYTDAQLSGLLKDVIDNSKYIQNFLPRHLLVRILVHYL